MKIVKEHLNEEISPKGIFPIKNKTYSDKFREYLENEKNIQDYKILDIQKSQYDSTKTYALIFIYERYYVYVYTDDNVNTGWAAPVFNHRVIYVGDYATIRSVKNKFPALFKKFK